MVKIEAIKIRTMRAEDIPGVYTVQTLAYAPHFHEPQEVIAARFEACPDTAWVAEVEGAVCAYLVGYTSRVGGIAPLHTPFFHDGEADCLYLHDLALAPSSQGKGVARALIETAQRFALSQGYGALALLSVQNSQDFWAKFGFVPFDGLSADNLENLRTYLSDGDDVDAVYMVKREI